MRSLAESWCHAQIVHTGQHYDYNMSESFFRDLRLPEPDFHLEVGSGSHAEQTGRVMIEYEKIAERERPDWIVVAGDVNSTLACALVGTKFAFRWCTSRRGCAAGIAACRRKSIAWRPMRLPMCYGRRRPTPTPIAA